MDGRLRVVEGGVGHWYFFLTASEMAGSLLGGGAGVNLQLRQLPPVQLPGAHAEDMSLGGE